MARVDLSASHSCLGISRRAGYAVAAGNMVDARTERMVVYLHVQRHSPRGRQTAHQSPRAAYPDCGRPELRRTQGLMTFLGCTAGRRTESHLRAKPCLHPPLRISLLRAPYIDNAHRPGDAEEIREHRDRHTATNGVTPRIQVVVSHCYRRRRNEVGTRPGDLSI